MPPASPTVAAWELGLCLREAREMMGLTAVSAARESGIAQNYLSDIEHGKRKIAEDKLRVLADAYNLSPDERDELLELRKDVDRRGWWSKYTGLFSPDLLRYFGYEHGAESIRTHESLLIPGLLQTERYARAIITSDSPNIAASEADRRVEARLARQQRLFDADPLHLTAIISEGALKQAVGGDDVRTGQLRHLIDVIEAHESSVEVLVVPFSAGAHGALGASTFHVVNFPSPRLPNLVWQETVTSTDLIANAVRVHQYSLTYAEVRKQALDGEQSRKLIQGELAR